MINASIKFKLTSQNCFLFKFTTMQKRFCTSVRITSTSKKLLLACNVIILLLQCEVVELSICRNLDNITKYGANFVAREFLLPHLTWNNQHNDRYQEQESQPELPSPTRGHHCPWSPPVVVTSYLPKSSYLCQGIFRTTKTTFRRFEKITALYFKNYNA